MSVTLFVINFFLMSVTTVSLLNPRHGHVVSMGTRQLFFTFGFGLLGSKTWVEKGFSRRLGGVKRFYAGIQILMRGRASKNGPVRNWHRVICVRTPKGQLGSWGVPP